MSIPGLTGLARRVPVAVSVTVKEEQKMMVARFRNAVKFTLSMLVFTFLCPMVRAETASELEEYKRYTQRTEEFNAIQRAADMPEMDVKTYAEWRATWVEAESVAIVQRDNIRSRSEALRTWRNAGVRTSAGEKTTIQEVEAARRDRLWAKSASLLTAHREELAAAREWAELNGFAEQAKLPDGRVEGLVGLRNGVPRYNVTFDAGAADTIAVDEVWPGGSVGVDLTGSNIVLGIWDGGDVLTNHFEFTAGGASSRAIDQDGVSTLPIDAHPTAVAGTMAAGGNASLPAPAESPRGMSYQSELWAYDWIADLESEMNSAFANDVRVSNHSYGEKAGWDVVTVVIGGQPVVTNAWWADLAVSATESHYFGHYDDQCTNTDAVAYGNPYSLPVWAAGNDRDDSAPGPGVPYIVFSNGLAFFSTDPRNDDYFDSGYDTIPDHGIAKNVLTVGAVYKIPGGYSGSGSVVLAPFSGFGPTDDGRIKPDVVAAGADLTTPILYPLYPNDPFYYATSTGNSNSPSYATGTSFSSPSASGAVGLFVSLRDALKPGQPFWASTLKAITIHTADDAETTGPDYKTGWGLMNAERGAALIQQDHDDGGKQYIKEVLLLDGDFIEFPVTATGGVPLKVSIGWTDPAGPEQPEMLDPTNRVLVNDLDVRVVSTSGVTNYPWTLDPANPSSAATTGDNVLDNIEQVIITNPPASATYTVRVTHKGNLVDDTGTTSAQGVSLILSGILPEARTNAAIAEIFTDGSDELLAWPSVVGQNYKVQTDVDLMTPAWTNVSAEISATKTNVLWESGSAPSGEVRFYRLIETN